MLTRTADNGKGSLLMAAADGGNHAVFSKVSQLLHGEVSSPLLHSLFDGRGALSCQQFLQAFEVL